ISDLVLGSTPPQRIYGGLGLSELNFLGLGLALSGAFVYGGSPAGRPLDPSRFAAHGNFFAPDIVLDGLPLVFGVSAIALRGEELTCPDPRCDAFRNDYGNAPRLRYERFGGDIAVGIRPGPFERLLAGYRMEHLEASTIGSAVPSGASGPLPFLRLGRSTLAALTGSYDRDTRNDLFFPTGGTRLSLAIVFASKVLGSDYDYSRYLLQLESDHRLLFGHALKLLGAAGAVQGEAPFFERFYPADFAYFSIGPALGRALELNFSTDSRYDSYLGMVGAEYGIPLWSHGQFFHRGYLALGVRWLYSTARAGAPRTTASSTPFSGDVALRLDTPVGSFNFSAAYALDNFL
ncbi:MAG TPA: BamA/TamA family outer membrane protein, partial [Anaeromyxobacteraceae bacterium]|nr:BamA/TamA family outer membrane protein [Anaeromyxobacteraceae bacterium]